MGGNAFHDHGIDVAVTVEFTHVIRPLVKTRWAATWYELPTVADSGPAPVELPDTVEPGGSGLPIAAGQFLNSRPAEGVAPAQTVDLVGVKRKTVIVETVRLPEFWRVISHVPVPVWAFTVTLSDVIATPFPEGVDVDADVEVELVPFDELTA